MIISSTSHTFYLFFWEGFAQSQLGAINNETVSITWCHSFVTISTLGWVPRPVRVQSGVWNRGSPILNETPSFTAHNSCSHIVYPNNSRQFSTENSLNRRLTIKSTFTTPFLVCPSFPQDVPKTDNSPNFWTEPCPPPPFQQTSRFTKLLLSLFPLVMIDPHCRLFKNKSILLCNQ